MTQKVVIVGTGQAGVQAALSLRDEGFEGDIALVGEEPGLPYQRPPLSKAYLTGKTDDEGVLLKSAAVYADYRIDLIEGVRVDAVERPERRVRLSSGAALPYDRLVLATGARQRLLDVPGASLDGVLALRTLADAQALKARLDGVRRAVVVGGGFIGLEFAAVAASRGIEVIVVEIAPRPMGRALSAEMSRFFEERHIAWGVKFMFGVGVAAFHGIGSLHRVELSDGVSIEADLALIGVGVIPNAELAAAAGLEIGNGIVVDETLGTSDPAILAAGDCAWHPNRFSLCGPVRIESVQNAVDQGRVAAAGIMGRPRAYDALPWFWSDQAELKLQIAGLSTGQDTAVVRGDPAAGQFSVFCFAQGRLIAVESVNRPTDHILSRRLIAGGVAITPDEAADPGLDLKALLRR